MSPDGSSLAVVMVVLTAVATLISATELIAVRLELAGGGVFDWTLLRTGRLRTASGAVAAVLDALLRPSRFLGVLALQIVTSAVLLIVREPHVVLAALVIVLGCHLLTLLHTGYGVDSSDRMVTILLAGGICFYAAPTDFVRAVALWFVGAQACLAYFTSGVAKLRAEAWRSGQALAGILGTTTFGSPAVGAVLARRPWMARLLSWLTIAFECSVVAVLVLGLPGWVAFVAVGVLFHVCIAVLMGLSQFLWSFLATYSALLYLARDVSAGLGRLASI